jgi:hypothetical protein
MEMKTELHEAMAAGVFVEVRDAADNTLARAVYVDWRGRPVPAVGDQMICDAVSVATGRRERHCGRVRARRFDVQTEANGGAAVWVHVVLDREAAPVKAAPSQRRCRIPFSAN